MPDSTPKVPILFGEALYDQFPGGVRVLGGAPFNVAWHLQGLGLAPVFITAVGRDPDGDQLLDAMRAWGMDVRGVQRHPGRPTGRVEVSLSGGQPRFEILPDQAYDHIQQAEALAAVPAGHARLLYHGTLALRGTVSAASLEELRTHLGCPVFLDVNLRPPWSSPDAAWKLIERAHWLKLNETELADLAGVPGNAPERLAALAADLCRRAGLGAVWMTRGADGALVADDTGVTTGTAPPVSDLRDTVGAGDAFSAVVIAGLIAQWPAALTLSRALAFAARICKQSGAIAEDEHLYADVREIWQHEL